MAVSRLHGVIGRLSPQGVVVASDSCVVMVTEFSTRRLATAPFARRTGFGCGRSSGLGELADSSRWRFSLGDIPSSAWLRESWEAIGDPVRAFRGVLRTRGFVAADRSPAANAEYSPSFCATTSTCGRLRFVLPPLRKNETPVDGTSTGRARAIHVNENCGPRPSSDDLVGQGRIRPRDHPSFQSRPDWAELAGPATGRVAAAVASARLPCHQGRRPLLTRVPLEWPAVCWAPHAVRRQAPSPVRSAAGRMRAETRRHQTADAAPMVVPASRVLVREW